MPSIVPVLIVGTGEHRELAAALRARGLGPMLAPDVDQAVRLLRNFRVDVVISIRVPADALPRLAERAPTIAVGGLEVDASEAGAAAFVAADARPSVVADVVARVAAGEHRARHARSGV
jgi:hypothetical protein